MRSPTSSSRASVVRALLSMVALMTPKPAACTSSSRPRNSATMRVDSRRAKKPLKGRRNGKRRGECGGEGGCIGAQLPPGTGRRSATLPPAAATVTAWSSAGVPGGSAGCQLRSR